MYKKAGNLSELQDFMFCARQSADQRFPLFSALASRPTLNVGLSTKFFRASSMKRAATSAELRPYIPRSASCSRSLVDCTDNVTRNELLSARLFPFAILQTLAAIMD
jgi:hypothetical protein